LLFVVCLMLFNTQVQVKLVDFAHTLPNAPTDKTIDTNFLSALNILVTLWEDIASFGREIFENQRLRKQQQPGGFSFGKDALLKSDRAPFSNGDGRMALVFQVCVCCCCCCCCCC
jgi:hypothetical protein